MSAGYLQQIMADGSVSQTGAVGQGHFPDAPSAKAYASASAKRLLRNLHHPAIAFRMLHEIGCEETRKSLAVLVAQAWARQDINAAWNTVARSSLSVIDKQMMYNELWG